jgi:hypothetical protein
VRHPTPLEVGRYFGLTLASCVPADPQSKGSEATVRIASADLVPGFGDGPPRRTLRARIAHGLQLALGDVRANAAVAGVNPLFDLVPKRVDQFTAVCRRGLQFASIA